MTFRFANDGKVDHDAFIGDAKAQEEHGEAMASGDHAGHNMKDGDSVLLEPGESGEITHEFKKGEKLLIGCHQPGHYEAGMKSEIAVS